MIEIHEVTPSESFEGTVIDIETIGGPFKDEYNEDDARRYLNMKQTIFGCITSSQLDIYCCENQEEIKTLKIKTRDLLFNLKKPFYAFNHKFEKGVWEVQGYRLRSNPCCMKELQQKRERGYESKHEAVEILGIPQYDDPFNDKGALCMTAWLSGNFEYAIAHNRSCLLKERDILIKRYLVKGVA